MATRIADGDLLAYSACNARFHARILTASGHRTANRLVTDLRAQMVRFQFRTILVPGRPSASLAEHGAILEALVNADPDAAQRAMTAHLSHVVDNLPRTSSPA